MTQRWLKKWYSILLPVFPVFIIYGFKPLPFLTFSDYLLMFFMLVDIVVNGYRLKFEKTFISLIVYLLLQPILLLMFPINNLDFVDAAGTAWKLALYIFGISLLGKNLQKKFFLKSTRIVATSSTIYGFLQFFLGTYAHISLSPYLPFLPILRTGLKEQQDGWIAYNWTVRPRAWFSEPSTFAIFLLLALMVELFAVEKEERKKSLCAIYVIGIVISHSSTGMIGIFIVIIAWVILCPKELLYKLPRKFCMAFVCLMPILIFLLYKSGYIDSFIGHTFVNGQGLASQSHFAYIRAAFTEKTSTLYIFLGNGMQDVETGYLPGWFRTYYCLGVIGVFLYITGFWKAFKRSFRRERIIILTFVGLNFGTEIMLGVFMLLYMSAAMMWKDDCEDDEDTIRCFDSKNTVF